MKTTKCAHSHTQYKTSSIRPSLTFSSRQLPIELILVLRTAYTLPLDSIHQVDNGSDPTDWILGRPVDAISIFPPQREKNHGHSIEKMCETDVCTYIVYSLEISLSLNSKNEKTVRSRLERRIFHIVFVSFLPASYHRKTIVLRMSWLAALLYFTISLFLPSHILLQLL